MMITPPFSKLSINQLKLNVFLGWPSHERDQLQTITLDISVRFSTPPKACATDNLDDTFCYGDLTSSLRDHLLGKHFYLIEHLAQTIYTWLKSQLPTESTLLLTLTKFPAIKGLESVSFQLGDNP